MAHREVQGRIQLAEQQVRMYREAMEHLIEAPATGLTTTQLRQDMGPISTKAEAFGGENNTRPSVQQHTKPSPDTPEKVTGSRAGSKDGNNVGSAVWRVGKGTERSSAEVGDQQEHHRLIQEIQAIRKRRAAVWRQRELLANTSAELARCRVNLLCRRINLDAKRSDVAEARQNSRSRKALYSEQLVSTMRMGALNDCFHIWHQGPFATINGFRVGRLNAHVVDWQEVNAGVGQAAIVLVTVAMAMGVEFSKYLIAPCGSFTKIARSEDGRVLYSLHTDESFSLFPRRNFNFALKAFLQCLGEVGEHVQEHDPTLRLPYHIKEKEGTVGGLPVALGSSYEDWTRALKYMLTDLKWIAAWAAKYLPPC